MLNPWLPYFFKFADFIAFYCFNFSMDKGLNHSVFSFGHNQGGGFPHFGNSLAVVTSCRSSWNWMRVSSAGFRFKRAVVGSGWMLVSRVLEAIVKVLFQNSWAIGQSHHTWKCVPWSNQPRKHITEYEGTYFAILAGTRYQHARTL